MARKSSNSWQKALIDPHLLKYLFEPPLPITEVELYQTLYLFRKEYGLYVTVTSFSFDAKGVLQKSLAGRVIPIEEVSGIWILGGYMYIKLLHARGVVYVVERWSHKLCIVDLWNGFGKLELYLSETFRRIVGCIHTCLPSYKSKRSRNE